MDIQAEVGAIADITFPEGSDFLIHVPANKSPKGATIKPIRIPFTVTTNERAAVSFKPTAFFRIKVGDYLGTALGPNGGGNKLGYDIIVQFPVPSQNYHGLPGRGGFGNLPKKGNLAHLPGANGTPTPALVAVAVGNRQQIYGVVHIVAEHNWTASGGYANPGDYRGSFSVTVTSEEM